MIETTQSTAARLVGFYNRMVAAGVDPSSAQRSAIRDLILGLEGIGISKFKRIFPCIGGTAATHALEFFGNDITWFGTVTHNANGPKGNGTNGYGRFALDCNSELGGSEDASASCYVKSMTDTGSSNVNLIGSFQGTPSRRFYMGNLGNSLTWAPLVESFTTDMAPPSASPGTVSPVFLAGSLRTGKATEVYRDGVSGGGPGSTPAGTMPGGSYCAILGVINNDSLTGSSYTDAQLAFVHIGSDLTDEEHASLYSVVEAYQVALGREN
jgi:hypothetical protein